MNILIAVVASAAGLYVLLLLFIFVFQANLIYFPTGRIHHTPGDIGLSYNAVTFRAADGVSLTGWFIPASSDMVVLFCHGNAGNISDRLDSIKIFHHLGLNTFIFDYRGFGESEGRISEQGSYLDAEAAWNYLVQERGFAPERIVVFGRSLGGAVATHLAMARAAGALVIESTFTSIPDLGARLYPLFPVRLLARFSYPTSDYIARVRCPVLVVHSPEDDIVPYDLGMKVYQAANEPKEFLEIAGDHNSGFLLSGARYVRGLKAFINKYLQL